MTEQLLRDRPVQVPATTPPRHSRRSATSLRETATRYPWILGAIGLLVLSTIVVVWSRTRPGYDPFGWLVWGKLTVHLKLDTNGAPSWKPLPFLFTVPYSVLGHYALWLWMITSVGISLSGFVFAWRIAFRLTGADPARRYAAYVAGLAAALALLVTRDYTHFILSSQSDTMIVSLCLAAIDCHLTGRHRWAFWCWLLGSLGRPEVWPFLALSALWLWVYMPTSRRMVLGGGVLLLAMWFGIPALTSKSAFTAGNLAQNSPRALRTNRFFGTIDRFLDLQELPVQLASVVAVAFAGWRLRAGAVPWRRKGRTPQLDADTWIVVLAIGAVAWVLIECAFSLHGWPSVSRYLFEPVGVMCALCGVAVGRAILLLPRVFARAAPRLHPHVLGWATGVLVAAFGLSMAPAAHSRYQVERKDLKHERARTAEIGRLSTIVGMLGTSHILACGQPNIPIAYQSVLAWYMGIKIGELYYLPSSQSYAPHPVVNMYPIHNGWKVFPSHVSTSAQAARCRGLTLIRRT